MTNVATRKRATASCVSTSIPGIVSAIGLTQHSNGDVAVSPGSDNYDKEHSLCSNNNSPAQPFCKTHAKCEGRINSSICVVDKFTRGLKDDDHL